MRSLLRHGSLSAGAFPKVRTLVASHLTPALPESPQPGSVRWGLWSRTGVARQPVPLARVHKGLFEFVLFPCDSDRMDVTKMTS